MIFSKGCGIKLRFSEPLMVDIIHSFFCVSLLCNCTYTNTKNQNKNGVKMMLGVRDFEVLKLLFVLFKGR